MGKIVFFLASLCGVLCHTTIFHTPRCHTPSFRHLVITHHLSHIIFVTSSFTHHLCHTPSFTHLYTPCLSHSLSHTIFHTSLSHTIFVTPSFTHHLRPLFCVASVALMGLGWVWWRAWVRLVTRDARDVALLRGRHGAWRDRPAFCVAGVALGDIGLRFAWQAWRLSDWAGSGRVSPITLSHTTLSHTIFHAQLSFVTRTPLCHTRLCHTPSFTHNITQLCHTINFVTHHLSHQAWSHTHTLLSHTHTTSLSHTIFHTHTQLCRTPSFTHIFATHNLFNTHLR